MKYKLQHALKNADPTEQDWQEIENDDLSILMDEIEALNIAGHDWTIFKCFDFFRKRDKTWHKNASAFTISDSRIKRGELTLSIQNSTAYKDKKIDETRDEVIALYDEKKLQSTPIK